MWFWILVVLSMVLELGLHYFPWRMIFKGKKLHRVAAYMLGTLALMGPFSVWLWRLGEEHIIFGLWIFVAACGLTVMSLHGFDELLHLRMRDIEHQENEELRKRSDGA